MAANIVQMYHTVAAKLSQLDVTDGNLIFVTDKKEIFLDINGNRLGYSCIQVFSSEQERLAVLAPIEGFYFVEETNSLWRYKNTWKQLTPDILNPIMFGITITDFPTIGNEKVFYITDDATYKWDTATQTYVCVSNKTEWKTLGGN